MAFDEDTKSKAPDISEVLPYGFQGSGYTANVPPKLAATDPIWDVGFADQGFMLAATADQPYRRETAEVSKQQLDTSKEPGEQTLAQFWLRSQTSWHKGAGINFYEPATIEETQHRFSEAVGVDVWTEGQLSLLQSMTATAGTGRVYVTTVNPPGIGATYAVAVTGTQYQKILATGAVTSRAHGLSGVNGITVVGSRVFVAHAAGIAVWDSMADATSGAYTGANVTCIRWVKHRLIAAVGPKLYELTQGGTGDISTMTPIWTHPDVAWTWSSFCDAPTGILAGGYSGAQGLVYRIGITSPTDGTTPKLSIPEQIAEMPPGELVFAVHNYLGSFVGLGTSRGIRIGTFSEYYNTFSYGPLSVETTEPVLALTARDRFCYATVTNQISGKSGAVRVDLSTQVAEGRYAWAWDAQAKVVGNATGIGFTGTTGQVVLGIESSGTYVQRTGIYETSGYLLSGKIRYATSEMKSFRMAKIRAQTNSGDVALRALVNNQEREILQLTDISNTNDDLDISAQVGQVEYAQFRLVLQPNAALTTTPIVEAFSVKALPGPARQRLIQYPVMVLDHETDRYNVRQGYPGNAWERLSRLEALEESQTVILVQDFTCGDSYQALIERVQFSRQVSPQRSRDNFGGIGLITVRKLL